MLIKRLKYPAIRLIIKWKMWLILKVISKTPLKTRRSLWIVGKIKENSIAMFWFSERKNKRILNRK